ncbi:hypothetical protein [Bradyrhizobium sp. ORS 86]|uniref:hypothetical protein n=1 Tax=Bradyrhizobium sp. ORS 86 TaxID=1685970 RepID=UPI0038905B22
MSVIGIGRDCAAPNVVIAETEGKSAARCDNVPATRRMLWSDSCGPSSMRSMVRVTRRLHDDADTIGSDPELV